MRMRCRWTYALVVAVAAGLGAQAGPRTPAQVAQVNLLRTQLLVPLSRLYTTAVRRCSAAREDQALVDALATLAGRAYVFSLVVVDPQRYFRDRVYRDRIDRAYRLLAAATAAAARARRNAAAAAQRDLAAAWKEYRRRFDRLAFFWSAANRGQRRLQALELVSAAAQTRVGRPVPLRVFACYDDGSREPIRSTAVLWRLRPEVGANVTRDSAFVAQRPGTYQVTAIYQELVSPAVVIRVAPARPESRAPAPRRRSTAGGGRTDEKVVELGRRWTRPATGGPVRTIESRRFSFLPQGRP